MLITHPIRDYRSSIHTENDEDYQEHIATYKTKAQEEAGPGFEVIDAFAICGEYAYSWHFIITFKATHSEEIRTYVYEEA